MDFLTKEWVAISAERGKRPFNFTGAAAQPAETGRCPFCPENADLRAHEQKGRGAVTFLPNLYPALDPHSESGFGYHEIIVDTPIHNIPLHALPAAAFFDTLATLKDRVAFYERDERVRYIQVFKNNGCRAGASIPHAHWQLVAMPFVPERVRVMLASFDEYRARNGGCCLCAPPARELLVRENAGASASVPYAALFPYSMNITPKRHISSIADADEAMLRDAAALLKTSLTALRAKNIADFNILLFNAPARGGSANWHFFFQIVPKLGSPAGFELSTYSYMSSVLPEDAARELREVLPNDILIT